MPIDRYRIEPECTLRRVVDIENITITKTVIDSKNERNEKDAKNIRKLKSNDPYILDKSTKKISEYMNLFTTMINDIYPRFTYHYSYPIYASILRFGTMQKSNIRICDKKEYNLVIMTCMNMLKLYEDFTKIDFDEPILIYIEANHIFIDQACMKLLTLFSMISSGMDAIGVIFKKNIKYTILPECYNTNYMFDESIIDAFIKSRSASEVCASCAREITSSVYARLRKKKNIQFYSI